MYSIFLAAHLIGASITGIVMGGSGFALYRANMSTYRSYAIVLGALAAFEILSGIALSVVSIDVTALSLCRNVALYLSAVGAMEALLFVKMRGLSINFPTRFAFSPVMASLMLMVGAIAYGF